MKVMAVVLAVSCPPGQAVGVTIELTAFSGPGENAAMFKQREAGLLNWVRRHFGPAFPLELDGVPPDTASVDRAALEAIAEHLGWSVQSHPANIVAAVVSKVPRHG